MGEDARAKRRRRGEAAAGEALASTRPEPFTMTPKHISLTFNPERRSRAQTLLQVTGLCRGGLTLAAGRHACIETCHRWCHMPQLSLCCSAWF